MVLRTIIFGFAAMLLIGQTTQAKRTKKATSKDSCVISNDSSSSTSIIIQRQKRSGRKKNSWKNVKKSLVIAPNSSNTLYSVHDNERIMIRLRNNPSVLITHAIMPGKNRSYVVEKNGNVKYQIQ